MQFHTASKRVVQEVNLIKIALLFPGQGSQVLGMGKTLAQEYPIAGAVFEQADQLLNESLSRLAWEGPLDELNDTLNTQPALLVHSVAALFVLQQVQPGLQPAFVAGHSMGELSALVAAQALDYPSALHLARRRGELMKEAGLHNPGGMAAILGLDIATLESICSQASTEQEIVQVANDNCPGQVVISGHQAAIQRAIQLAQQAGARKAKALAVSIAAHSPLMARAQADFNQAVNQANFTQPSIALVGNVSAQPLTQAGEIQRDLMAQLTSPVRWTESIQWMISQGVTHFIELGSGSVLTSLLKRINDQVRGLALGSPPDYDRLSTFLDEEPGSLET